MLFIAIALFALFSVSQAELPPYRASLPNVVPRKVYEFLKKWEWGNYHVVFHASRKYYVMGDGGRRWLSSIGARPADLQEGDPKNGVEFLTMHRAMINFLRERFGSERVTNDIDGRTTFSAVLDGWRSDREVVEALRKKGGDVRRFEEGLRILNNFAAFESEDDFGNYLQTSMKLTGQVDPNDSAMRYYDRDSRAGAGVHNWLHGQFHDSTPLTVGDPETNLANNLFWRIHGWIEWKWTEYEKAHQRTRYEQRLFDRMMNRFNLEIQIHSDWSDLARASRAAQGTPIRRNVPQVPAPVKQSILPSMFSNHVRCRDLAPGTRTWECPQGRSTGRARRS